MSIWHNTGFTENELSRPAKVIVGLSAAAGLLVAAAATMNAIHGIAPGPRGTVVIFVGYLLFLFPKLFVVRHIWRINFGTFTRPSIPTPHATGFSLPSNCALTAFTPWWPWPEPGTGSRGDCSRGITPELSPS